MARLDLDAVSFGWGGRPALDAASLSVTSGEVVALLGPNGAGKSTLLRVAAGLLRPGAGAVLLDGEDVRRIPRARLARRLGGVAAAEDAGFPFTVRETVALGRHAWRAPFAPLSEEDRRRVEAALAATGMAGFADRPLPTLSTGERQRAAIARALAQDPEVLLLDEPTAHLDLGHRLRVLAILRAEAARGKAVLAALHDLELAALAASRIVLLDGGRVVADGAPAEVLTPPRIREIFGAEVEVLAHPRSGGPLVVPVAPAGGDA